MKNFISVVKKELYRFFSDKRMILTTIILPAVLIYTMYSLMGEGIKKMDTNDESYVATVHVCNMPSIFEDMYSITDVCNVKIQKEEYSNCESIKENIIAKDAEMLIIFPAGFSGFDTQNDSTADNIEVYYNSSDENSLAAYNKILGFFEAYESSISNVFDINAGIEGDLATDEDIASTMLSMFIPMMVILILFNSCLSVSAESIAGEKERGTIATVLVTPINRYSLAVGKVFSLSFISLLSGMSSLIGIIFAIPKILEQDNTSIGMDIYSISDYLALFITICSAVMVIVSIVSVISAYARSAKEATTMTTPLTIIATLTGMLPILVDTSFESSNWHLIPIFNNVLCINKILSFSITLDAMLITVLVNLFISVLLVFILTKMFDNEKILFSK